MTRNRVTWVLLGALSVLPYGCSSEGNSDPAPDPIGSSSSSGSLASSSGHSSSSGDVDGGSDVAPSAYWRHTIGYPTEPFAAPGSAVQPSWVKFSIRLSEPDRVYFQDSVHYTFHYDFAKNHFPGHADLSESEFAARTLYADGQTIVTGAVLYSPTTAREVGIQLVREDAYSREDVKRWFDLVSSKIVVEGGPVARFYMPTFAQRASAEQERDWLTAHQVPLGSPERWLSGDACYAPGWAFGPAKFFSAGEIAQAYQSGQLTYRDILITDGVPAEVPYVAGIVSLSPATPNSHVAILANTWDIPFVYPLDPEERATIRALSGHEVVLRTRGADSPVGVGCKLEVIEPSAPIDATTRQHIADLKRPPTVQIPAKTHLGALTRNAVQLHAADAKYFGGKASNFGTLRRAIPDHSPLSVGVSFDLWDAFLAQLLDNGHTLREEIQLQLAGITFPTNVAQLETKLAAIRAHIEATPLPATPRAQLFAELQTHGFPADSKLRFRSSTNVEDGAVLSGAGLYDSYSGCLADDLDADNTGPSRCDASEANERGAERAIKRTFRSFYNTNAVLERLKHGIDEDQVGMAMAVNLTFDGELANGVATVHLFDIGASLELVTQLGETDVANPDGDAVPESVHVDAYTGATNMVVREHSSLVPLGQTVMTYDADYTNLANLLLTASRAFRDENALGETWLDLEYKKEADGALSIKQIRAIPRASDVPSLIPVQLDEPIELCSMQGEYGDILGVHRTKTRFTIGARSTRLDATSITSTLWRSIDARYFDGSQLQTLSGIPSAFPAASHTTTANTVQDGWTKGGVEIALSAEFTRLLAPSQTPITFARDYQWLWSHAYPSPKPTLTANGGEQGTTRSDMALLERCPIAAELTGSEQVVESNGPGGVHVRSRFRYGNALTAFDKTARLGAWSETTITGLIASPIVLHGWYSQSFRPGHHNFDEDFAFEPALEEGIAQPLLDQLAAADIRTLVVAHTTRAQPDGARFYVVRASSGALEPLAP